MLKVRICRISDLRPSAIKSVSRLKNGMPLLLEIDTPLYHQLHRRPRNSSSRQPVLNLSKTS